MQFAGGIETVEAQFGDSHCLGCWQTIELTLQGLDEAEMVGESGRGVVARGVETARDAGRLAEEAAAQEDQPGQQHDADDEEHR